MNALLTRSKDVMVRAKALLNRHSRLLITLAALVFGAGILASIAALDLSWSDLDPVYFAVLALVLTPLGVMLGAINMVVLARSARISMNLRDATYYSVFAQLAEILPLPGGAMVRGGVLVGRGASAGKAASLVLTNAVLWVGCAAFAAGLSLGLTSLEGALFAAIGGVSTTACLVVLSRISGTKLALAALAVRLGALILVGARLAAAFLALGTAMSLTGAYPFAFASILGSASSLAPGGLGISELLAAGMANLAIVAPGAAFLAVALNRIVGFVIAGLFFAAFQLSGGYPAPSHG